MSKEGVLVHVSSGILEQAIGRELDLCSLLGIIMIQHSAQSELATGSPGE